jgi:hypothetical protein
MFCESTIYPLQDKVMASLGRINWITKPDPLQFAKDIQHIIADILSLP